MKFMCDVSHRCVRRCDLREREGKKNQEQMMTRLDVGGHLNDFGHMGTKKLINTHGTNGRLPLKDCT